MERIELAKLIEDLRSELSTARSASAGADLRFEVGPVELELTIALSREGGPSARVRFWVLELGGDAKLESAATQKLKLTLTPRLTSGETALVAGTKHKKES
jgi:hypothetical protein